MRILKDEECNENQDCEVKRYEAITNKPLLERTAYLFARTAYLCSDNLVGMRDLRDSFGRLLATNSLLLVNPCYIPLG